MGRDIAQKDGDGVCYVKESGGYLKVSVICPVYNGGEYLRPMLNSIVNQTLEDIEIILVDDSSTDGSKEVCEEYRDSRVTVLPSKRKGEKWAVDTGREIAKGDYIIIVDDDDVMEHDALRKLYEASEGVADAVKGTALMRQGDKLIQSNARKSGPFEWRNENAIKKAMHFLQPPELWSILLRRDFQKDIELGDYIFNDTDFVWKVKLLAHDFRYIPDPVYCWNIHPSASHSKKYPYNVVRVFDELEKFIKMRDDLSPYLHELWRIYASHRVQTYYWNLERLTEEDLPKFNEIAKRDFNREIILTGLLPEDVREWYEGLR